MATRLQKYTGKNTYNNNIHIDFNKKTVDFRPIKGETNKYSNYLCAGHVVQRIALRIIVALIIITVVTDTLLGTYTEYHMAQLLAASVFLYMFTPYMFILGFVFSKRMRDNFPKINAALISLESQLGGQKRGMIKGNINLELIRDRRFVITDFDNIYFKYKLSGEVAKFIRDIKIINTFKDNPYIWEIHLLWSKTPKTGNAYVEYM